MYYDGFFSVLKAAQEYHNMNMYDQNINLDQFIFERNVLY
jgi:hypothetical protein